MQRFLSRAVIVIGGISLFAIGLARLLKGGMLGANAGQELWPQLGGMASVFFGAVAIKTGWDYIFSPKTNRHEDDQDDRIV